MIVVISQVSRLCNFGKTTENQRPFYCRSGED